MEDYWGIIYAIMKSLGINELEKWLKEEVEATVFDYHFAIEDVLDKLQELKGSDKE